MPSTRPAIWMTTVFLLGISAVLAQEPSKPEALSPSPAPTEAAPSPTRRKFVRQPTPEEDIRAIRQMMEEQALKVEAISQQVSKLATQVSALSENAQNAVAKPGEPPTPPAVPFTPSSASSNSGGTSSNQPIASGTNPVHVVAKGETLTSIARHSKVTVAELLKLNKIENDRALQIGQTLVLPSPKPVETPVSEEPK